MSKHIFQLSLKCVSERVGLWLGNPLPNKHSHQWDSVSGPELSHPARNIHKSRKKAGKKGMSHQHEKHPAASIIKRLFSLDAALLLISTKCAIWYMLPYQQLHGRVWPSKINYCYLIETKTRGFTEGDKMEASLSFEACGYCTKEKIKWGRTRSPSPASRPPVSITASDMTSVNFLVQFQTEHRIPELDWTLFFPCAEAVSDYKLKF